MTSPAAPMTPLLSDGQSALVQLRAYLSQRDPTAEPRLPPERELCGLLGVSRGALRKALAVLEAEGDIWRHVGKGTFIGGPPPAPVDPLAEIADATNPADVMRARILLEPEIAREAALHASAGDLARMQECLVESRRAESWRHYETWDNSLHRAIAEATGNRTLVALFDTLNAIRRAVVWGRLRPIPAGPPASHHSFAEHEAIVRAIADRDRTAAAEAMRRHLQSVERHLLEARQAAE